MEQTNTRRGDTQIPVNKKGHYREMLSGIHNALTHTRWEFPIKTLGNDINKYVGMPANLIPPHPAFGHPLPQGARRTACGFSLIELLVVVLIIGILAAVAVPQYQRAVKKTRLTEYFLYLDSLYKGIDIWLLTNGIPEKTQYFTGETPTMTLDIDMPFTKAVGIRSYTKFGRLNGACGATHCWIDLGTAYDDYSGFLEKGAKIYTTRFLDSDTGKIILTEVPNDTQDRKLVCEWWATHYGKEQMEDTVKTKCADVGI